MAVVMNTTEAERANLRNRPTYETKEDRENEAAILAATFHGQPVSIERTRGRGGDAQYDAFVRTDSGDFVVEVKQRHQPLEWFVKTASGLGKGHGISIDVEKPRAVAQEADSRGARGIIVWRTEDGFLIGVEASVALERGIIFPNFGRINERKVWGLFVPLSACHILPPSSTDPEWTGWLKGEPMPKQSTAESEEEIVKRAFEGVVYAALPSPGEYDRHDFIVANDVLDTFVVEVKDREYTYSQMNGWGGPLVDTDKVEAIKAKAAADGAVAIVIWRSSDGFLIGATAEDILEYGTADPGFQRQKGSRPKDKVKSVHVIPMEFCHVRPPASISRLGRLEAEWVSWLSGK